MRRLNIFIALIAILFSSCVKDETLNSYNPSTKGGIKIIGAVEDYDIKSVGTRADNDIADSYISEMTMFIFKSNGDLIQGYSDLNRTNECSSAINIQRGNPTFLVDTEEGILADLSGTSNTSMVYYDNSANDLGACKIYIVANAWHQLQNKVNTINTLTDLESVIYDADATLSMPMIDDTHYRGFPMIGTHLTGSFNLEKDANNEGNAVATIPLKKLYSKVNFTMQINANQIVANQIPKFTISKVEVFNVPKKAHLGREIDSNGKPVYGTTDTDDYITEMGISSTYTHSDYYYYCNTGDGAQPFVIDQFKKTTIYHSTSSTTDDVIEFGFYMPEHKVTPNTITYPENINDEFKQYYKPVGVGESRNGDGTISASKIATFVRIHGTYTDHNGQILGVKYDIYLGQNNTDDFTIKRNQLLNNKLIITGLTNHKDAYPDVQGNISIDHRVEIDDKGYSLSMERTAILDAHFEVRPLDIELSPNSQMTITIPDEYRDWIAMENDAAARSGVKSQLYVNTSTPRKGVRNYFTTNLVSELNANEGYKITLSNNVSGDNTTKTFRIWFYIDENRDVYDKTGATLPNSDADGTYNVSKEQYRNCPVKFKYMGTDKNGNTLTKDATINFQQWNLWRVWSADGKRYYDIEHEEEYLNNYASDMQYGQTQDGMPWGLDGIQLSDDVLAYWAEKVEHDTGSGFVATILEFIVGIMDSFLNFSDASNLIFSKSGKEPYFDFYLSRDNFPVNKLDGDVDKTKYARDYKGIEFNREIAATLKASTESKAKIDDITLVEAPQSAFAYCYNKNKRNSSGKVVEQKWFLPAIDEIEEIALGAYDEFDRVFQNQKYWSCQPAYEPNNVIINPIYYTWREYVNYSKYITMEGKFYNENLTRARSTSVFTTDGKNYQNIKSGVPDNVSSGALSVDAYIEGDRDGETITNWAQSNINYSSAIFANPNGEYRGNSPRTEKCRIRAVYRSGSK